MIRKTIFWVHLASGIVAGLVILLMSATGVILTYERQILDHFGPTVEQPAGARRVSLSALVTAVERGEPEFKAGSISIAADPAKPVVISAGRGNSRLVDPYSGSVLDAGGERLENFFGAVTGWHRWFNAPREARAPWRAITGASNLIFLFLLLSGLYLWLPRVSRWAMYRARLLFVPLSTPAKARDFNWHHVIGIWSAIPLLFIVATAAVFYYPWANALLYRSFGEMPPGAAEPAAAAAGVPQEARPVGEQAVLAGRAAGLTAGSPLSLDALLNVASRHAGSWQTITLPAHPAETEPVSISIDEGNGGQPQHRHTLVVDHHTGAMLDWQPFTSQTPGRQARSWARFLHTGEALGIVGQTVAGLVSLTTILMVWTGFALAYRRLIMPLFARSR